ncbi:hypothetical protein RHECNPAF_4310060 [Rhizobium etli CNPAF512]|nr:hypothetical protein RHECNPAF_4310060 [Rhizobium etli CNPAF512]
MGAACMLGSMPGMAEVGWSSSPHTPGRNRLHPNSRQAQFEQRMQLLQIRQRFCLPRMLVGAFHNEQEVAHFSGFDRQFRQEIDPRRIEEFETGQVEGHLLVPLVKEGCYQ